MDSMNNKFFPANFSEIGFEVNNQRKLVLVQKGFDNAVCIAHIGADGFVEESEKVSSGDFVMLLNLYHYIKSNDIRNDFINPNGKNKEE